MDVKYVNRGGSPRGCSFPRVNEPGQIIQCDVWENFYGKIEDTLVEIRFLVRKNPSGAEYLFHVARIPITSDSVFYTIPELPEDMILDANMREVEKKANKEYRREAFDDLMTDWRSYFLYVNFFQGNRPYGEISFSNARYSEIETGNPFRRYRSSEPGFVRGPTYGAEFNFLWRKNDFILGPKLGFQIASRYVNLGLSGIYYTDFTQGMFCLKPRIGINPKVPWINFSYEYAFRLGYNYFGNRINRHQFSVYFVIPLRLEEY